MLVCLKIPDYGMEEKRVPCRQVAFHHEHGSSLTARRRPKEGREERRLLLVVKSGVFRMPVVLVIVAWVVAFLSSILEWLSFNTISVMFYYSIVVVLCWCQHDDRCGKIRSRNIEFKVSRSELAQQNAASSKFQRSKLISLSVSLSEGLVWHARMRSALGLSFLSVRAHF